MIRLGSAELSRFILGGNPFSGFAHQSFARDEEMRDWYTMARIKEAYRLAEAAGVTAHLGRADELILRALREYRLEGGRIDWIAQTCPLTGGFFLGIESAKAGRAKACFLHGGEMDQRVAAGDTGDIFEAVKRIKDLGMAAGVAGHTTDTIQWAADRLEVDFFMTCYYNPSDRSVQAARDYADEEYYGAEDRDAMCALIQQLPAPAIHYKVLAAGRHDPRQAFEYVAQAYRPGDAVCVGVFTRDNPDMVQQDVDLLEEALERAGK
jgi:hypothetical protein